MSGTVVLFVVLIVGLALGAVAGYVVGHARANEASRGMRNHEAEEARALLNQTQGELNLANQRSAEYRTQAEGLADQLAYVKSQLAQTQQAEQNRIRHEREQALARAEEKRQAQQETMEEESKVLSALAPVQKNLDALREKVAQIEEGRKQEMGALGEQLKGLGDQQTRLGKETGALAAALRNNKVRGAWGEAQLKNIVESAGLTEHVDFDTQVVAVGADGETLRPDMVVHLPGGKSIPIDAKAPYSDYQRACAIPDSADEESLARKSALLKAHAKAMRDHVRTLGGKAYWQALDSAPDFVIAFIPNESLLQAALETDPTLLDDAFAQKVALTSPVTLWAVLKSVAYAWQQQNLTEDAKELFTLSRELYERMAKIGEYASGLGGSITRTVAAYNKFVSSLESRVLPTARKLQRLDQSTVIGSVSMLDSDVANVKEITAPELSH